MKKIRKAVIPAAGLGTRFLPATKAQPKEMLPIVDKPTIQYIVEEAAAAGIEDILIISGRNKRSIEDHFDKSYELEAILAEKEKWNDLKDVQSISSIANVHYIRQKEMKGLGDAVYCAHRFIGDEPFAVLLGDLILQSGQPGIKQLIDVYEQEQCSVIGSQQVTPQDIPFYGIIEPLEAVKERQPIEIKSVVEKPSVEEAPSEYAIIGRYVLTPSIFQAIEQTAPGAGNEIQLTDAIQLLNKQERIVAQQIEGMLYDIGSKNGFVKATIDFAIQREDLRESILSHIHNIVKKAGKGL